MKVEEPARSPVSVVGEERAKGTADSDSASRTATPERWPRALARGLAEGVTVRQLNNSGAWVATSGTDATMASLWEITGTIAHGGTCPAGQHEDPVCTHRAISDSLIGALDLPHEPDPPAPSAVVCFRCHRGFAKDPVANSGGPPGVV